MDASFIKDGVEWRQIPDTKIWCSADGKHISKWIEKHQHFRDYWLRDEHGYLTISIVINNVKYCTTAHRVIAYCFGILDSLESKLDIDHINNNRKDNRIENLQAISHKENCRRRKKTNDKKVRLYNEYISVVFKSKSDAARWLIEKNISKGSFEATKCNLSRTEKPYGFNLEEIED